MSGPPKPRPTLSLLRLRDLYIVVDFYGPYDNDSPDWYDYLFHSHQCPQNIMRRALEVFCPEEGNDPHGIFRFVASVDDNSDNRTALETRTPHLDQLFRLFGTDGQDAPTKWPESERGLISWIAKAQDAERRKRRAKG